MEETVLGGMLVFLHKFGFYNVILPFLLVFAIIYAILDKTKIFGAYNNEPLRGINSIVAFAIALLVVGASNLVRTINIALANVSLIVLIIFSILLTTSMLVPSGQMDFSKLMRGKAFPWIVGVVVFVILIIFIAALGWLGPLLDFVKKYWKHELFLTFLFLIGIAIFIGIIVSPGSKPNPQEEENTEE